MRNKNLQGGGLGQGYTMGEMISRGNFVNEPYGSCGALSRPGAITTAQIGTFKGGLPGLSGGSRRHRKHNGNRRHKSTRRRKSIRRMRGGRYGMAMEGPEFAALGPRGGMMATAERMQCESGVAPHISQTTPTAPAMRGGAQLAPEPFLQEQTAGYRMSPSQFVGATGAPIMLSIPDGGQMGVPACKQTGGRRQRKQRGEEPAGAAGANPPAIAATYGGDPPAPVTPNKKGNASTGATPNKQPITPNPTPTPNNVGGGRKQRKSRKQRKQRKQRTH